MKKILIIEDEKSMRKIMVEMLSEKYEVLEASDGVLGLSLAFEHKPAVILLDLLMPNMDGQEMLKLLRKDSWGKSVPVIVLSNEDDAKNIALAHEGGLTDYIIKSNVTLEELRKKVKVAILLAI